MSNLAIGVPAVHAPAASIDTSAEPLEKPQDVLENIKNHQKAAKDRATQHRFQKELEWSNVVDVVYSAMNHALKSRNSDIRSTEDTSSLTVDVHTHADMYNKDIALAKAINARLATDYQNKLACRVTLRRMDDKICGCHDDAWCFMTCILCCIYPCFRYMEHKRQQRGVPYKVQVHLTMDPYLVKRYNDPGYNELAFCL